MANIETTWNTVEDVDGYNVYLKEPGSDEFEKQNSELITDTEYTIENITTEGTYEGYVTSVRNGLESEPSEVDSVEYEVIGTPFELTLYSKDNFGNITANTVIQIGSDNVHPAAQDFLPFHVDDVTEKVVFTEIEVVDVQVESVGHPYTGIIIPFFFPYHSDLIFPELEVPDGCTTNPNVYNTELEILKEDFNADYGIIIVAQSGNPTEWGWCQSMGAGTETFKIRGYYI